MSLKVSHIISGLGDGGAEGVMTSLCLATQDRGYKHTVFSLTGDGRHAVRLEKAGIRVVCLGMNSPATGIRGFLRLIRMLVSSKPDVVQTWMYHADLIGGIAARLAGIRALVWGLRNSAPIGAEMKRSTRAVVRCCGVISRFVPRMIVVCARNAVDPHIQFGYPKEKIVIIQNGYDFTQFSQTNSRNKEWRDAVGIERDIPLIGLVARYSPQKDHMNLLRALRLLHASGEDFHCALIGSGMDGKNTELASSIDALGLSKRVSLLGARSDIPNAMSALELHVLSSRIEGFPNVLAEAMASGTPCVSTDVGDAEWIIAGNGWLVPKEDADALAYAIGDALTELRESPERWQKRQSDCRRYVRSKYGLKTMVDAYLATWQSAAAI